MAWGIFKKVKDGIRKIYETPVRFIQNKLLKPAIGKMKNLPGVLGDIGTAADKFVKFGERVGIA